jgi:thymidylate synthase ThyX
MQKKVSPLSPAHSSTPTAPPTLPSYFHFSSSDPSATCLRLISLHDDRTGFTVRTALSSDGKQVPAIMAFAGARFSRSALSAEELFAEINTSAVSAQQKLAAIFNNYGHASVGDMAMLFAYIENVPRYLMFQFFYSTALGGGQERSSRFQDFSKAVPPQFSVYLPDGETSEKYASLQSTGDHLFHSLVGAYQELLPVVQETFTNIYQPEAGDKKQASALQARTFDTVRAFLPAGTNTSGAYITSSREWARLCVTLKSSHFAEARYLGEQLDTLFNPPESVAQKIKYVPEAPDLLRHTEADPRTDAVLAALQPLVADLVTSISGKPKLPTYHPQKVRHLMNQLSPASGYLYFSLLRLYPMLTARAFTEWYGTLSTYTKHQLSTILFSGYDHHAHVPNYGHTGGYTFEIKAALSEIIDFNRHRAWGRFTPFLETADTTTLINDGYTLPLYLEHKRCAKLRDRYTSILDNHYKALSKLSKQIPAEVSPRFLLSLLPNAHYVRYYLTGGPQELSYLPQLRVRPGGHINYRVLAYRLAEEAATIDPLLQAIQLPKDQEPHPFSRTEFFDRG